MRIGIDARLVLLQRGIGNAVRSLVSGLARIPSEHDFFIYVDTAEAARMLPTASNLHIRMLKPRLYPLCEHIALPTAARRDRLHLLHSTANTAPLLLPPLCKRVVTIHDAIFFLRESADLALWHRVERAYYRTFAKHAARHSAIVITDSKFSRNDISRLVGISRDRMVVVYLGIGEQFFERGADAKNAEMPREVTHPYIVALAAADPRKNSHTLIAAFARFKQYGGTAHRLVLVGLDSATEKRLLRFAAECCVSESVQSVGFVSDDSLAQLYAGADVMVYLSLYEGFGLPVLEAMACGTPVIASAATSIPEIAGDAALLVPPTSRNEVATAMLNVVGDFRLRRSMRARGRARSGAFTCDRMARETLIVYERALA